jgi:hypothetical protein
MYVTPHVRRSVYRDGLNVHSADVQEIFGLRFELPEPSPLDTLRADFESTTCSSLYSPVYTTLELN